MVLMVILALLECAEHENEEEKVRDADVDADAGPGVKAACVWAEMDDPCLHLHRSSCCNRRALSPLGSKSWRTFVSADRTSSYSRL